MTKLGELLKSEREKRSLSLHEIGMSLKINPKILKAIEDGDQANFPAKTFLRGFVKSYAQYLRLDVNEALQMFQDEYGSAKLDPIPTPQQTSEPQQPAQAQGVPKYENSLKRPDDSALPVANNNRIYTILFAILLLTLIAFVAKMMDKYQKESRDAKSEIAETSDSTTTTSSTVPGSEAAGAAPVAGSESTTTSSTLPPEGATATTAISGATTTTLGPVAAVPSRVPVTTTTTTTSTTMKPVATTTTTLKAVTTTTVRAAAMGVSTTTTLKPAAVTTTTMRAAAVVTPTTTTTLRPVATTTTLSAEAGATTTTTTLKPTNIEVIIEALNRVSIRFSLNAGQKWETLELNPDQVHTFRSKTSIQLEISDGGAVNVIVNGRDRGVPGTIGKALKLKYP